jgi:hypothetical protein
MLPVKPFVLISICLQQHSQYTWSKESGPGSIMVVRPAYVSAVKLPMLSGMLPIMFLVGAAKRNLHQPAFASYTEVGLPTTAS